MANQGSTRPDDAGHAARVGSVIKGKWTVERLLGVGGMAAVYAATHRNGQRAALKILHADFGREKSVCERFLREAYVSNKVNHAATVQVLDDDVTDHGEPFLVMELLEGETVRDAWKSCGRTMPLGRVLQICERVLDCLASCHAIKVIHRDLKPANVFITSEERIKVLDFGVAQMRDASVERTATGTALGTPAYMSPEQAMGLVDQLDGRADLFSVGAMMHALLTGHRINNGRTEQEALVMAATKPVPSVARIAPHLSVDVIRCIDKALAWDRRNRFQDAREMQKALLDLMAAQGVTPLAGKPPPRPHEVVAPPPPEPPSSRSSLGSMPVMKAPGRTASPAFDPLLGFTPPPPGSADMRPRTASVPPASRPPRSEATDPDPRLQTLRDLMRHVDRLLPSVRQLGWAHPSTERTLRTCHEAFAETLAAHPTLVSFALRPYSFMALGHTVWEPNPPFDAIPYNLFAAGVRTLRLEPGLSFEEMRELVALLMLDPGRDLPPEDDIVAALWEKSLPHVRYECADAFAEGDAAERERFFGEADALEQLAETATRNDVDRLEVAAMAVSTDDGALVKKRDRSPFALDAAMRAHLLPFLDIPREAWAERYVDALVEGYLDAATNRDAALILASLRRSAADLVVANRLPVALQICHAVIVRLRVRVQGADAHAKLATALTSAMFGGETLALLLKDLKAAPAGVDRCAPVLAALTGDELPIVLAAFREADDARVRSVLANFIEHHAGGHETEIAQAAPGSEADAAAYLVQLLARMDTPAARAYLAQLQQHEDVDVRIEARILAASSLDQAQTELSAMLDDASAVVRMAALRAITRYVMRNAWPTVSRIIGAKGFAGGQLGRDERRELLRACVALSPERGEPMLLELAKKSGVLVSEDREATRAMAAELLGDFSKSRAVAAALQELAGVRWGISEETRAAAAAAARKIGARLGQP